MIKMILSFLLAIVWLFIAGKTLEAPAPDIVLASIFYFLSLCYFGDVCFERLQYILDKYDIKKKKYND